MTTIKYIPEIYLDEINPEGRDSPNDWVIRRGRGFALDRPFRDAPERAWNRPLPFADQQVFAFSWVEDHGTGVLVVNDSGWSCTPPMPAAATTVRLLEGYSTSIGGSIDEMLREEFGDDWPEGEHPVEFYTWHTRQFRFDAASGRFGDLGRGREPFLRRR